jgi:hypothetical protein
MSEYTSISATDLAADNTKSVAETVRTRLPNLATEAAKLTRDLSKVKPTIYWADFLA